MKKRDKLFVTYLTLQAICVCIDVMNAKIGWLSFAPAIIFVIITVIDWAKDENSKDEN